MVLYLVFTTVVTAAVRCFLHLGVAFSSETRRAETRFFLCYDDKFINEDDSTRFLSCIIS